MPKLETWHSIHRIDMQDWDSVAGDNVMSSHGWLRTVEETFARDIDRTYYLVRDNGRVLGAAVSSFDPSPRNDINLNTLLFGRQSAWAQRLGLSFLPALECYPYRAYGKHFFISGDLDPGSRRDIGDLLLDGIEAKCARHGASPCFLHVTESETELWRLLTNRRYHHTLDYPMTYLDVDWPDFNGYKNYIRGRSRNMARNITKEINRNRRAGVVIEPLAESDGQAARLWDLLNLNYQKHNPGRFPFKRNFFNRLKTNLGDDALLFVARKAGRITAVCVALQRGQVAYIPMVGVDHALTGPDATYFNLTLYHSVRYAIRRGLKRIYFGNAQYELKQRRGCKISNCYIFYKSIRPAVNPLIGLWFRFHRYWYRRKHRGLEIQPYRPISPEGGP